MASEKLPLELQLHVYSYLDPRSFNAARSVSRWWRYASKDSVTLAAQLRQLPIHPLISAKTTSPEHLQTIYNEAAHTLMLGMKVDSLEDDGQPLSARVDKSKIAVSADGRRAATLEDREIIWWNTEHSQCQVISRRPLNDLRTAIGGGPWFKCAPTSIHELALSSDGRIAAVALERTIQIYDLSASPDSWPVSSYIPSASGHYIAGLEFQHNDSLLRAQLSNKGAVVYLGSPKETPQPLQHWQGKGGLKHAFFDSSRATLTSLTSSRLPETLAGLRLLRPFRDGWLFAAQKRCAATQSASYCVGHVAVSAVDGHVLTAEKTSSVLTELPSSVSSTPLPEIVHKFWHDLPSAVVQHPHFSMSADGSLLAMSENVGTFAIVESFSRVFVFCLPSAAVLSANLDCIRAKMHGHGVVTSRNHHIVQRLPLSIGTIAGKVLDFRFEDVDNSGSDYQYQLSALSQSGSRSWTIAQS